MYGSGTSLLTFFSSVARMLPEIAVLAAGLVVVLGRKANHPKASSLAAAGLAIALGGRLLGAVTWSLVPTLGLAPAALGGIYSALGILFSLVHAGAIALLVAAVVAERAQKRPGQQ